MGPAVQLDPQGMSDALSSGPAPDGWLANARAATADAIRNGVTAVGVIGGPDTVRTALCEALATGVDDRSFTASITDPSIDPDAFLLQLLRDFGLSAGAPASGHMHDRHTLSAAVVKFLKSLKPLGAHALVIIDDAEQVGVDVYETVLQLAQAAGSEGNPLRLVLVGQPLLDARLAEPPLSEFPADGHWTRVVVDPDTRDEVPGTSSALSAPAPSEVATSTPAPHARAGALAVSPRLLALAALLTLVAIGAWWVTGAPARQSESAPPSTTLVAPAAPAASATPPATEAPAPAAGVIPPVADARPTSPGQADAPTTAPPGGATVIGGAATAAGATGSRGSYRIVIASFRTATRAQQVVGDLQRQRLAAAVRADPTNTWHQVVAGPYTSIDTARQAQRAFERAGFADTQISLIPQTTNR